MKEKQGPSSGQVTPSVGTVIPKRHARSAVTRSLLKRQIRAAMRTPLCANLYPGMWVVRLRAPFDRKSHPSAASQALRAAARDELATVIGDAMKRINS